MDKERLLKLASELHDNSNGRVVSVPQDGRIGFDIDTWGRVDGGGKTHGCGTAACALGYAGLHPWFRRRGLRTNLNDTEVKFNGFCDLDAAVAFFGIRRDEAAGLFTPEAYAGFNMDPTPKQVAKRIRAFVKNNGQTA